MCELYIERRRSWTHIELERDVLQPVRGRGGSAAAPSVANELKRTHLGVVVCAHLLAELAANPLGDQGLLVEVEPALALDRLDDPAVLALAAQDVAEAGVVREAPQGKVQAEEDARGRARQDDEEDELRAEEEQGEEVDVLRARGGTATSALQRSARGSSACTRR